MTKTEFKRYMKLWRVIYEARYEYGITGLCSSIPLGLYRVLRGEFDAFINPLLSRDRLFIHDLDKNGEPLFEQSYYKRLFVLHMFEAEILNSDVLEGL